MGTAESLRDAMESRGLSVPMVSGMSGVSERSLHRMRSVDGYGSLESWLAVAESLGCGLDEITGGSEWTSR